MKGQSMFTQRLAIISQTAKDPPLPKKTPKKQQTAKKPSSNGQKEGLEDLLCLITVMTEEIFLQSKSK